MKTLTERIGETRKFLDEFKARTSLSLHELEDIEGEFSDEDMNLNYVIEGISNIDNNEDRECDDEE
jgi:hypothetical protein